LPTQNEKSGQLSSMSSVVKELIFGVDEYIRVRAGFAECLMNAGRTEEAIKKFEGVKRRIQSEVVFDKPVMFINICN